MQAVWIGTALAAAGWAAGAWVGWRAAVRRLRAHGPAAAAAPTDPVSCGDLLAAAGVGVLVVEADAQGAPSVRRGNAVAAALCDPWGGEAAVVGGCVSPECLAAWRTALSGAVRRFELTAPGNSACLEGLACPVGPRTAAVLLMDVTRLRRTERELAESELKYRSMMEAMEDLVYICSQDYRIEYMNPAMVRRTGRDATGEHCYVALHGRDVPCAWCVREEILRGQACKWDVTSPSDGHTFHVSNVPLCHSDGRVSKMAVIRDITDRVRAEQDRATLERRVEQTQKLESLGVMAGGIAHDFSNLLVGVLGNAQLARAEVCEGHPASGFLAQIEQAARRAAELCHQMLACAGRGGFEQRVVSLNDVIMELDPLLHAARSGGVRIETDFDEGLPSIVGEAGQLRQAISNITVNAIEAMTGRTGAVRIVTRSEPCDEKRLRLMFPAEGLRPGRYVVVEVQDDGCGMSESVRAHVFDPFYTTKFAGRGLGLSAAYGVVRRHGGGIAVASREHAGSCFGLYLPCNGAIGVETNGGSTALAVGEWSGQGTVLVVDDEPAVRLVTAEILRRCGFDVLQAADGVEAVERLREDAATVRAVVLDLTMPRMDGEQTFRAIRELRPDVPVLLSSGYGESGLGERFGERRGRLSFIAKPFEQETLLERLRSLLEAGDRPSAPGAGSRDAGAAREVMAGKEQT